MLKRVIIVMLCLNSHGIYAWNANAHLSLYGIPYNSARIPKTNKVFFFQQPGIDKEELGAPFLVNPTVSLQCYNHIFLELTGGLFLPWSLENFSQRYNRRFDLIGDFMLKAVMPLSLPNKALPQLKFYIKGGLWGIHTKEFAHKTQEKVILKGKQYPPRGAIGWGIGGGVSYPISYPAMRRCTFDMIALYHIPYTKLPENYEIYNQVKENFLTVKIGINIGFW
jgi:hypothetical protein